MDRRAAALVLVVGLTAGCGESRPVQLPTVEPIAPGAVATTRPTLRPISSPELAVYCDDPATAEAYADLWNAEAAIRRAIGAADPDAQAEAEAWAEAARAAVDAADAARPLPSGWGGPGTDPEGTRLALGLLCMARRSD